ncbi:MAG: PepSY domain-containing protein [Burkholderiales bacterium]|jgi:uncharacterized membrane protein YkoI
MNGNKLALSAAFVAATLLAFSAQAYDGEKYAKDAKISIKEARSIALKAFAGKIVDEELEHEKGGSGLRYSFDIRKGKTTQEVGVDAKTGKVLENDPESAHPD